MRLFFKVATKEFSFTPHQTIVSDATGLFLHVRRTPQQNSQWQFWASVCVSCRQTQPGCILFAMMTGPSSGASRTVYWDCWDLSVDKLLKWLESLDVFWLLKFETIPLSFGGQHPFPMESTCGNITASYRLPAEARESYSQAVLRLGFQLDEDQNGTDELIFTTDELFHVDDFFPGHVYVCGL